MTSNEKSGTIMFLDREFDLKLLEQAIGKSTESYIEPGSAIHAIRFDETNWPEGINERVRRPVVTLHEGKYVVLVANGADENFTETKDGIKVAVGFKAKFVTKYNFNQAKYVPPAPPVVHETPAPRAPYPKREWTPNRPQGQRNHSGGNWNGQARSFGNRGN
jgi:hypothetical protein